jgi:hypothetical protein
MRVLVIHARDFFEDIFVGSTRIAVLPIKLKNRDPIPGGSELEVRVLVEISHGGATEREEM